MHTLAKTAPRSLRRPPHPRLQGRPANPPATRPLVAAMKQARAFGVGVVVAMQNPLDLDCHTRHAQFRSHHG
jgi:hypothetical protein